MSRLHPCCASLKLRLLLSSIFVLASCTASLGAFASLDLVNGPEDNLAAAGRLLTQIGGTQLGTWSLETSVANTDFSNAHVAGGDQGVQYTLLNAVFASADINEIVFSTTTEDSLLPQISIRQTPYFQDPEQWNGGNLPADVAQFTVRWDGGGLAEINDPLGQFVPTGPSLQSTSGGVTEIASGTTLTFSDFQIFNSEDAWAINLPVGVESVEVDWGTSQPTPQSDLTREWVAFNVTVVPEPSDGAVWLFATGILALGTRRRSIA